MPETVRPLKAARRDPERLAENFREVLRTMNVPELQVLLEVQAAEFVDRALIGARQLLDIRDGLDRFRE